MTPDRLFIRKEKAKASTGWRPITIAGDVWEQIDALSEETGISKNQLATTMLSFALARVEVME